MTGNEDTGWFDAVPTFDDMVRGSGVYDLTRWLMLKLVTVHLGTR